MSNPRAHTNERLDRERARVKAIATLSCAYDAIGTEAERRFEIQKLADTLDRNRRVIANETQKLESRIQTAREQRRRLIELVGCNCITSCWRCVAIYGGEL